ncbi:hypothetical protein [Lactobacillus sp. LL6]|uniref:hypothetical protein n=1 Tax=Lactobacillus sp. LL6 TaxID=2596827 RepID=UPI0011846F19|nr:hypothetical protein [Lactobacillus sp. LL6]TSO26017.1 hypothetical protein FOD82_02800 [Lactobacillus sp. LL6]
MSLTGIIVLVLVAVIILSMLFALFHIFIMLLPVAAVAVGIIWLLLKLSAKKGNNMPSNGNFTNKTQSNSGRKKARNVTTKDVDK